MTRSDQRHPAPTPGQQEETTMTLYTTTIERRLSNTVWLTAGQVCDELRQCGPLAFHDEQEYQTFRYGTKDAQYRAVYKGLMRLRNDGLIDTAIGDDSGRETRVFKEF